MLDLIVLCYCYHGFKDDWEFFLSKGAIVRGSKGYIGPSASQSAYSWVMLEVVPAWYSELGGVGYDKGDKESEIEWKKI